MTIVPRGIGGGIAGAGSGAGAGNSGSSSAMDVSGRVFHHTYAAPTVAAMPSAMSPSGSTQHVEHGHGGPARPSAQMHARRPGPSEHGPGGNRIVVSSGSFSPAVTLNLCSFPSRGRTGPSLAWAGTSPV